MKSKRNPLGLRGKWTWHFNHSECRCGHSQEVYPVNFSRKHRYLPPYNKEASLIEGDYWIPSTGRRVVLCNGKHDTKPGKTKGRFLIPNSMRKPERIVKNELWGSWKSDQLSIERYAHGGNWYLEKESLFSWEQEWFQRTTIVAVLVTLAASSVVLVDYGIKVVSWIRQFECDFGI